VELDAQLEVLRVAADDVEFEVRGDGAEVARPLLGASRPRLLDELRHVGDIRPREQTSRDGMANNGLETEDLAFDA
jgi:hypothetical protein